MIYTKLGVRCLLSLKRSQNLHSNFICLNECDIWPLTLREYGKSLFQNKVLRIVESKLREMAGKLRKLGNSSVIHYTSRKITFCAYKEKIKMGRNCSTHGNEAK